MSHVEDAAGGKSSGFRRETSQDAASDAGVSLEAKELRGNAGLEVKFVHAKRWELHVGDGLFNAHLWHPCFVPRCM